MKPHTIDVVKGDILVADDLPASLDLLLKVLRQEQYRVRVTTRGKLVLTAARLAPPDLILLDINMPEMNGYEVCRLLKADPDLQHIPVIFVSALDEVFDKVKAFEAGAVDYVTKPFQFEEALARIETQLKIARLQKETEEKNVQLAGKNEELMKKNEELALLYKKTHLIFSALSEALSGWMLNEKYRLENKIGKGSNGIVYRAVQIDSNRPVAVKIFQPNSGKAPPELLDRMRLEGLSALRVNHPNVISVLDFGIAEDCLPYLVMELLEGRTLRDEIDEKGRLTVARCAEIIEPICNVLAETHQAGIIHRDVKPENIFLHQAGDREVVKVLDFGIAKAMDESDIDIRKLTITGRVLGTPAYLAPERLGNLPCDGRSDIYSLGVTLYAMLSGRLPFETDGDLWSLVNMHLYNDPEPLRARFPDIPESIEAIALRALCKRPEDRPAAAEIASTFLLFAKAQ